MDLGLRDRVAIVTGSSQGIGKAIAYGLAREGAKVTICARNEDRLREAARQIESSTRAEVLPVRADLREKADIESMVNETVERFGTVDILVNNAGGPPPMLFLETSEEDWREAADTSDERHRLLQTGHTMYDEAKTGANYKYDIFRCKATGR